MIDKLRKKSRETEIITGRANSSPTQKEYSGTPLRWTTWSHIFCPLYIVGCPLWRGCIDVNGKTIGTQKFVRYIEVSVIEGSPLSGASL